MSSIHTYNRTLACLFLGVAIFLGATITRGQTLSFLLSVPTADPASPAALSGYFAATTPADPAQRDFTTNTSFSSYSWSASFSGGKLDFSSNLLNVYGSSPTNDRYQFSAYDSTFTFHGSVIAGDTGSGSTNEFHLTYPGSSTFLAYNANGATVQFSVTSALPAVAVPEPAHYALLITLVAFAGVAFGRVRWLRPAH